MECKKFLDYDMKIMEKRINKFLEENPTRIIKNIRICEIELEEDEVIEGDMEGCGLDISLFYEI